MRIGRWAFALGAVVVTLLAIVWLTGGAHRGAEIESRAILPGPDGEVGSSSEAIPLVAEAEAGSPGSDGGAVADAVPEPTTLFDIRWRAILDMEPLPGLDLTVRSVEERYPPFRVRTGSDGRFRMRLSAGHHDLIPDDPFLRTSSVPRIDEDGPGWEHNVHFYPASRLVGRVVDASGTGVVGARVEARIPAVLFDVDPFAEDLWADPHETVTDSTGRYELPHLEDGHWYLVTAEHPEHGQGRAKPIGGSARQTSSVPDIVLAPGRTLTCLVRSEAGWPVAGGEVLCVERFPGDDPNLQVALRRTGTTDEAGLVEFDALQAERLEIRVERPGQALKLLLLDSPASPLEIVVERGHSLIGEIVGSTDADLSETAVTLEQLSSVSSALEPFHFATSVDENYQYSFDHIPVGRYRLSATGCLPREVDVPAEGPVELLRVLRRVEGRILGPGGALYEGACELRLRSAGELAIDGPQPPFRHGDVEKTFGFEVPVGAYVLFATDGKAGLRGRTSFRIDLREPLEPLEIQLEPSQLAIEGVVVDGSTGEGLAGANVQIDSPRQRTTTDDAGRFRFAVLSPGWYQLSWKKWDRALQATRERTLVHVQPDQPPPFVRFEAPGLATLAGHVRLPETQPLDSEIAVEVWFAGMGWGAGTDENGFYEFRTIPAGRHELRCEVDGKIAATRVVELKPGQDAVVDFDLSRTTASVEGRLRRDGQPVAHQPVRLNWRPDAEGQETDWKRTDTDGRFTFQTVAPGDYELHVELEGPDRFQTYELPFSLGEGEEKRLELAFETVRVSFLATTPDGHVLRDRSVVLEGTGVLGKAEISVELGRPIRMIPGGYRVRLSPRRDDLDTPRSVEISTDGTMEIQLQAAAWLEVAAVHPDGMRQKAMYLAFLPGQREGLRGPALPPGVYEVWARAGDEAPIRVGTVRIEEGTDAKVEAGIPPAGILELRRQDSFPPRPAAILDTRGHDIRPLLRSAGSSRYLLAAGRYRVVMWNGDEHEVEIEAGSATVLEVER